MAKENVNYCYIPYTIMLTSLSPFRFVFPSIIIPFMAIDTMTLGKNIYDNESHLQVLQLATFALISLLGNRKTLFCSSQYYTEALLSPTAYCSVTGNMW